MSRLWDSAETTPPFEWSLRPHVVDVRDPSCPRTEVDVWATEGGVAFTFAIGADTDLEVSLTRDVARAFAAALADAAGD